jgi:hypothetical protein
MANNNINELMKLPIWQMTGEEQYRIIQYALGHGAPHGEANPTMIPVDMPFAPKRTRIAGVHALALYLECCDSWFTNFGVKASWMRLLFRVSAKNRFRRRDRTPMCKRVPGTTTYPAF